MLIATGCGVSPCTRAGYNAEAHPLHQADVPKAAPRPLRRRSCRTLARFPMPTITLIPRFGDSTDEPSPADLERAIREVFEETNPACAERD